LPRLPPEIFPLELFSVVQKAKLIISFAWNLWNFCLRAISRVMLGFIDKDIKIIIANYHIMFGEND